MKKNIVKELNDIEHVLKRPGLYVGSPKPVTNNQYIYVENKNKFIYKEVTYTPALLKIIREVIDNSIDEGLRTNWKFANRIKINIEKNQKIIIEDNGRGIPCSNTTGKTMAEMAWCSLRAGSNFDDDDDSTTLGQNGVGVSLTHIMSLDFIGETCDGKTKISIKSDTNMSNKKITKTKGVKKFTRVSFIPDYKRFEATEFNEQHQELLYSDLMVLTQIYPKLEIIFNKKSIKHIPFKEFVNLFDDDCEILETDGLKIAVFPNKKDDFNNYHNINGLNVINGGNPLNWVINSILKPFTEKLNNKYKNLKQSDVKNKFSAIVLFTKMSNPRFNSQTKETCINTYSDFKDSIGEIDFKKFAENKLYKNKLILESIVEILKIKEEYEKRKALKELKPETKKRVIVDKYWEAFEKKEYLVLAEGNSARNGLAGELGRDIYGYFPLKGKPLNVLEVKPNKIAKSEIIRDILQILKLDITNPKRQEPEYKNILIATDADVDGSAISALLFLLFYKYTPYLFTENKISLFKTPLVVGKKKGKIVEMFFSLKEYNDFKNKNQEYTNQLTMSYYKGLGKWKDGQLKSLIKEFGIEMFIRPIEINTDTIEELLNKWFLKDNSDLRKLEIKDYKFDIEGA